MAKASPDSKKNGSSETPYRRPGVSTLLMCRGGSNPQNEGLRKSEREGAVANVCVTSSSPLISFEDQYGVEEE